MQLRKFKDIIHTYEYVFLFVAWICGIWYRLWLVRLVPQPFLLADEVDYYSYIRGILAHGLHAETIYVYGYALIIAPLVKLFGFYNMPWIWFQASVDSMTGVFVFIIARRLFDTSKKPIAWIAYFLYLANPYTSGFVGVLLTEVSATFFMALICLFFLFVFKDKKILYVYMLAFFLGFLPQIRPSFTFCTIILILYAALYAWKHISIHRMKEIVVVLVFYCLPYTYNVVTNIVHYQQFAPLFVNDFFACEIYKSTFLDEGATTLLRIQRHYPREFSDASDICEPPYSIGKTDIARRQYLMTATRIIEDPLRFIRRAAKKSWSVWEKHYIYPFNDGTDRAEFAVYWGNIILLLLAVTGLFTVVSMPYRKRQQDVFKFHHVVIIIIAYITIGHIFSVAAERFSLPAYPLIILYASTTIYFFFIYLQRKFDGVVKRVLLIF